MRALILAAGASLAVAACGKDEAAQNAVAVAGNATAESIASNDTTAIDAATGEDANMAADVELTADDLDNLADDGNAAENSADNREAGNSD